MATKKKRNLTLRQRNNLYGYAFMSLWIVGFLVFVAYPVIHSIVISLNELRFSPEGIEYTFKGLFYYDHALNEEPHFRNCLTVSLTMICYMTPIILVFSLIIAMILNQHFRFRGLFRVIFFMPVIIMSGPVISNLLTEYSVDFETNTPVVYSLIAQLPDFLATPVRYALDNFVLILWFCGVQILICLSGLQSISPDIYEAASIDGAGAWERFWKITLPHMAPMILICAVYTVVSTANYRVGGNVNALIASEMFNAEFLYSYSAAMAWMYFVVVALLLVIVLLIFKLFQRRSSR